MTTKPLLITVLFKVVTLLLLQTVALGLFVNAKAQDKLRGITLDEYKKAKTFQINDLENDTYVKIENIYVLDRYEMKPPYVFKYSDGIERRIYLYRLLDNKTKASLGMVAFYVTPGDGKKIVVPVPNPQADKAVWVQYIDDLKEYNQAEKGFGSTFAYVMSKEMAALASGSSGTTASSDAKTDYDVCFPAFALVKMADGSQKPISEVRMGEQIASYNEKTGLLETAVVQEIQIHDKQPYAITSVRLMNMTLYASRETSGASDIVVLQATPNHPVWTKSGSKQVGQLAVGAELMGLEAATGEVVAFQVIAGAHESNVDVGSFYTDKVYNLVTDKLNYVVNGTVVLTK